MKLIGVAKIILFVIQASLQILGDEEKARFGSALTVYKAKKRVSNYQFLV